MAYDKKYFENAMRLKFGEQFSLVGDFVNMHTAVLIKCHKCGAVESKKPTRFLNGGNCRGCYLKRHTKTTEQFKKQIRNKYGDEFSILGEYTFADEKIMVRHNKCGAEYEIRAASLLYRGGCVCCQPDRLRKIFMKSQQQFQEELYEAVGDEYEMIGDYVNAQTKTLFVHHKCGHKYLVRPNNFLIGDRCPRCRSEKMKCKNQSAKRIVRSIRSRIIHILRGRKKSKPTMELIGCSREEYVLYLEGLFKDGMGWSNFGIKDGWQVDHIRPCASFDLSDPQQQRECFNFKNTQPLWAKDNAAKSSIWNGIRFRS